MKIWIKKIIYILPAFIVLFSCEPKIEVPAPSAGSADFSRYIAVGNSLTAGYANGGLYQEGQSMSFPNIIAQQINAVQEINFVQPDIPGNGSGYFYLKSLDLSTDPPDVEFDSYDADPNWLQQLTGPFNNLGVPGIRVKDITFKGYGASPQVNPYFYRMLGGKDPNMSYLEMVQESNPTFFTCWLGNNDVLGYATSGGAKGIGGEPGTGIDGLTPIDQFQALYDMLIQALTANGAKGIVVTIPDVTLAPFFTTIPWNALVLDDGQAALANNVYSGLIDPQIRAKVKEKVIELVVTEEAVKTYVIPQVATGAVWQQAYQQAIDGGATDAQAKAIADAYVASADGQAAIAQLVTDLEAELRNHLLGDHANHQELEQLYAIIDNELATNTTLQQGIAQGITDLTNAYDNDLLPPDQKAALDAAIDQGTQEQIAAFKAAGIYPVFQAGPNGFVAEVPVTETNPLGIKQLREGELVLLTALLDGQLEGLAALSPQPSQYILTDEELANINTYTEAYNQIIRGHASGPDIGVVESSDILKDIKDGIFLHGVEVSGDFLTGGAFSLDGVHPTPRGYAIVANSIIAAINKEFNANVPTVIINNYPAVILP